MVGIAAALATGGAAGTIGNAIATGGASTAAGASGAAAVASMTASQVALSAGIQAGVVSAASQFTISAINNQGDLGRALGDIDLSSIATSALVGGISTGLEGALNVKALTSEMAKRGYHRKVITISIYNDGSLVIQE